MAKRKKKKEAGERIDASAIMRILRERKKPMTPTEIVKALGLGKQHKGAVQDQLDSLAATGKILRGKRGAYGLLDHMRLLTGKLEVQRSGVGFVIPEDKRRKDVFVSPRDFGGAWHGDKVVVALTREKKGNRNPEGRIVRVIDRGAEEMPARVQKGLGEGWYLLKPTDPRQRMSFMAKAENELEPGEIIQVKPVEELDHELWSAEVVKRFGPENDIQVQEAMVKSNHNIPTSFPQPVVEEAEGFPADPQPEDYADRRDMRDTPFVTIDGAKARDFDDAVYVTRKNTGYILYVAIADVSHYVAPGSELDKEAYERANSYYFPQSVEPMFPEALSNGLCSLNPSVPRLAMVAEIHFSPRGNPGKTDFYPAVIESHARLTYAQVKRAVIDRDEDEQLKVGPVLEHLELAEELARKLQKIRFGRGSLDFDLPEPEIFFNIYGEAVDIRPKARNFAHQIIEEFMIAANEAVARFLRDKEMVFLYRVHPQPDEQKVEALFKILERTPLVDKLPPRRDAESLNKLLEIAEDTDQEFMVGRLTLRTMMQAAYSPANEGHFGLASECYAHFTSPIRRYADLIVHRSLKNALAFREIPLPGFKRMKEIGQEISAQERVAMEAEREILKRITILFLQDKVGQVFTGVINSLADFGFWVELKEVMAEGMVRVSSLSDDYYTFFHEHQRLVGERTGRSFALGQPVTVRIEDVKMDRLEVNLEIVDDSLAPGTGEDEAAETAE
jgi:ribonuclease R